MSELVTMQTKEVIDRIFKEPGIQYELTEFENLGKPIREIVTIYPKVVATGKDAGKTKYILKSFFLENASPIMIPEKVFSSPMMARSHFHAGDVLLSIVGTIGSLSIVPENLGQATGSCKIAILRSKGTYSPFVLAAFLLSRFGQLQIRRNTRGAVQMGLILKAARAEDPHHCRTERGRQDHLRRGVPAQ